MNEQQTIRREGLVRALPFTLERAAGEGDQQPNDGLTLEGHAAVFGVRTVINSWEGRFTEELAAGAFRKTFRERTPVLQFDHGRHPLVGSIPIGKIKRAEEDDIGAWVNARLHDNWLTQPVRDAIAEESITGMSFRMSVVREEWRDDDGKLITDDNRLLAMIWDDTTDAPFRTIKEVKVPELGPVVFPQYTETDVSVRMGGTIIDLAQLVRDEGNRNLLARAILMTEQATVSDESSNEPSTPQGGPAPAGSEADRSTGTPQEDPAPVPGTETIIERKRATVSAADRLRQRLAQVDRR